MDVKDGQTVGDIAGANGYWGYFFGKAVGPGGKVLVHNASEWKGFFDHYNVMSELEPCGPHVSFHWSRMETPFRDYAQELDFAFSYTTYHDTYDMPVDRKRFLASINQSLKPGGIFVVIDHHAVEGSGCKHSGSNSGLHRVDKKLVIGEILTAGFILEDDADFLCNANDNLLTGAWKSPQVETDRFALKFRKA
jgi:predicted methyltransferase